MKSIFFHYPRIIFILAVGFLLIISSLSFSLSNSTSIPDASGHQTGYSDFMKSLSDTTNFVPVPVSQGSIDANLSFVYNGSVTLLITFKLQNETQLQIFLEQLSNRSSPEYHRYITRAEFASRYSVAYAFYTQVASYLSSFSGISVRTYPDRVSLEITGPAFQVDRIFHTTLKTISDGGKVYYASSQPELPINIAKNVASIAGFTNDPSASFPNDFASSPSGRMFPSMANLPVGGAVGAGSPNLSGYPTPVLYDNTQYVFGSDLQVAYDEQTLFNFSYPTQEVIATILWSGNASNGQSVGPYYPGDIYSYFNATLPPTEPRPHVFAVPLNGAPQPGLGSTYDKTGAAEENTLDLEMVGSTAPGSNIYNVYGPSPSSLNLDSALAFILNPNSTFYGLNNVSVISNSWGSPDYNDTTWYSYLQEAQSRGVSVLASSGDSGDSNASSKYLGTNYPGDYTGFPSSMAYNTFGVTAVGGTTLTLTPALNIESQVAWLIQNASAGGPVGSTGGISQVFPEPLWQLSTEANSVINGQGRGVPDISAVANNMLTYNTVNGTSYYYFTNGYFYYNWGTSVACPVEAGIVAEIDAVMNHYGAGNLGFLNPILYDLGNMQHEVPSNGTYTGYFPNENYTSELPMLPFYDVTSGGNYLYSALPGYDLVTGWGSINSYNLTAYLFNFNFTGVRGAAQGVESVLNLSSLSVTSYYNNGSVNSEYNASIQQNLIIANEFGAPIYWVQNVIYITDVGQSHFTMVYSGWVIYPFYGQYPNSSIYEYNFPTARNVTLPETFYIKTWLTPSPYGTFNNQAIHFQVNGQNLTIPVPGAAYIIDSPNYDYLWNGVTYLNGPFPNESNATFGLVPQFGVVGGPSLSTGQFLSSTVGEMRPYIEPYGSGRYVQADSAVFGFLGDQTGELASNLLWTYSGGAWLLSVSNGSEEQGVALYAGNISLPRTYNVVFNESGLPSGTAWNVTLNGTTESSTSSAIAFSVPNGTYSYSVGEVNGYIISPSSGTITVNGANFYQPISFVAVVVKIPKYNVTFAETGLPNGASWSVTFNGTTLSSNSTAITFSVPNGTYYYIVHAVQGYRVSQKSGLLEINGTGIAVKVSFSRVTYAVTFSESGLLSGTRWSVTFNGTTNYSTSPDIYFSAPNGSYNFSVGGIPGYNVSPEAGMIDVNGAAQHENISFSKVIVKGYLVGTISPQNATVWVNGVIYVTSDGNFNISLQPGTYEIKVVASGYLTYYTNVTINQSSVTLLPIHSLSRVPQKSSSLQPGTAVLALVAVIAVAGGVMALRRSRKRKS